MDHRDIENHMVLPYADDGAEILENDMAIDDIDLGLLTKEEIDGLLDKLLDELTDTEVIERVLEWAGDSSSTDELIAQLQASAP